MQFKFSVTELQRWLSYFLHSVEIVPASSSTLSTETVSGDHVLVFGLPTYFGE